VKLTKEERELVEKRRRAEKDAKDRSDFIEQYDNCYCRDEYGNWK